MKKIFIFIILLFLHINISFAYLPTNISNLIIGKIDKIEQFNNEVNGDGYEFNFSK